MIEVKNLTKKYGNHKAVDNISFTIEDGHIYGLLGPNGAGKSTTMNIITGYISASSGTVTVDGCDIVKEPLKARKLIGYLPEIPPLYNDMTVYEYLMFTAHLKGVKRKERHEQVEAVMEKMSITDMATRLIANLSKGYKQRVGFAQSLLGSPKVLIFDEPSVGLDPKQIIDMRDLILELGKDHTVILSSHILQEISAVCDSILIINNGKLIANGTHEEIRNLTESGARLNVVIEGSKSYMEKLLDSFDEIEDKVIIHEKGITTANITMKKDSKDIRKDLYAKIKEGNINLINMNLSEVTLEDVFLELTKKVEKEDVKLEDVIETSEEFSENDSEEYSGISDEKEGE